MHFFFPSERQSNALSQVIVVNDNVDTLIIILVRVPGFFPVALKLALTSLMKEESIDAVVLQYSSSLSG